MFYDNISYLVGSANAKLANDIKKIHRQQSGNQKSFKPDFNTSNQNRLTSLFCNNANTRQSNESVGNFFDLNLVNQMDLEFVKVNCKKENFKNETILKKRKSFWKKIFYLINVVLKCLLFLLIGSIVSYSIYRIIELNKSFVGLTNQTEYLSDIINNTINMKRSADVYSSNRDLEWSVQKMPSIYEIEMLTFFDSNNDGFGDLNGVNAKLDYIQNALFINCVLLKSLNRFFDLEESLFLVNTLDTVDPKIGSFNDLKNLIDSAHSKSMRVVLEIELTGTSTRHNWFNKETRFYYKSVNSTTNMSESELRKWTFYEENQLFYYSNERENFVYFNFDEEKLVDQIIKVFQHWTLNLNADGILLKNFNQIEYQNRALFQYFINNLQKASKNSIIPTFLLLTDHLSNSDDQIKKSLFDSFKIELDALEIYNDLNNQTLNTLKQLAQVYPPPSPKKKIKFIWSIRNLDRLPYLLQSRRHLLFTFYLMLYSLPGQVLIKQGDELEYEQGASLKLFRWNDLQLHSGFSNFSNDPIRWYSKIKNSLLNDPGVDLRLAIEDSYSLFNFFRFLNKRVKPKLNDLRPDTLYTTPLPVIPKAPQPFVNSYSSLADFYLTNEIFKLDLLNSCLKIKRQIDNYSSKRNKDSIYYSIKFYRNMLFLFNFSKKNIFIDRLVNLPSLTIGFFDKPSLSTKIQLHIVYDSSKTLPEYVQVDLLNHVEFYTLQAGHFLVIEF